MDGGLQPDDPGAPLVDEGHPSPVNLGRRFDAAVVDGSLGLLLPSVVLALIPGAMGWMANIFYLPYLVVLIAISLFAYQVICELAWGRSLGKHRTGLWTVRRNGEPLGFWRLYVRELLKWGSALGAFVVLPLGFAVLLFYFLLNVVFCTYEPGEFHEGFCAVGAVVFTLPLAALAAPIAPVAFFVFPTRRKDKRALHDLLTDTMVVSDARAGGSAPDSPGVDGAAQAVR